MAGKSFQWTNGDSKKTANGVKPTAKEISAKGIVFEAAWLVAKRGEAEMALS
jgi:hypothetical protein